MLRWQSGSQRFVLMLPNISTREILSPDPLVDAEGDVDSNSGETAWPETDPAEMQETDLLCNREAIDGSQGSECASQATESCLLEHSVALIASQMGESSAQEMDQGMDQALASALGPELSEASPTEAPMISTSDQEPEPRNNAVPLLSQVASADSAANEQNVRSEQLIRTAILGVLARTNVQAYRPVQGSERTHLLSRTFGCSI
ncbi:uncharacterized protein CC84DRAFT_493246 [Paraphaeosphaeria sporulosa]|uniref:Uncharacterized protein n=1 Tax=Paraphaeosphaeria sporulosa TaxID=1460663 RepID=A0A177CVF0_9PLEO|nr:uncharacterized protein CC84DRAFT_493246 [Paraphaeosphaeria sporulosa]OAG10767.1 hypothetical protein CC84DRAFT_493246 [Paraphaeosphaeria sporulosa]